VSLLDIGPAGVECQAGEYREWAGKVAVSSMPGVPTATGQGSAVAVAAIHAPIGMSGEALSVRMGASSQKLNSAAAIYAMHDTDSSARLTSVSPGLRIRSRYARFVGRLTARSSGVQVFCEHRDSDDRRAASGGR
jgi:hypothetical protein